VRGLRSGFHPGPRTRYPSGAAVPDASIAATLDATGATRNARTGADGRYRLPSLSIGTYTIRCEKSGFQRAEVPQVYLALNQTLEQTIELKLASAGSTIDVRVQPEALNTTAPTAGTGISGEVLEETPSRSRSYLGVVLLAPRRGARRRFQHVAQQGRGALRYAG
jgi:hypothetical protein